MKRARLDADRTAKGQTILTAPVVNGWPGAASFHIDTKTGARTPLAPQSQHEWAFIKTRWTPQGNGVKVLRCMHCRCEKHVRYNGTKGGGEYIVPGGTLTRAMPSCAK